MHKQARTHTHTQIYPHIITHIFSIAPYLNDLEWLAQGRIFWELVDLCQIILPKSWVLDMLSPVLGNPGRYPPHGDPPWIYPGCLDHHQRDRATHVALLKSVVPFDRTWNQAIRFMLIIWFMDWQPTHFKGFIIVLYGFIAYHHVD